MVKHIILWTLKEELSGEQKETIKQGRLRGTFRTDTGSFGDFCSYGLSAKLYGRCYAGFNFRKCKSVEKLQHTSKTCSSS